jgi:uncharacterized coiled-coil protein SlyX
VIATYPTGADYVEALQDTWRCFRDPELIGCSVRTDNFGIPRPISGNFASVFMAHTATGRKLAIKCFTRDVPDQQARYREIAAALQDVPADWKVEFRYVDAGVVVRGKPYPVLVMEWIAAKQLIPWIEDRLGDRAALARLADRFADLVAGLETAGIAHGDLQHGNLLVTARGELRLIDYDGMYVPALRDRPALELGQPNYQHPRRAAGDYGPWLDHFSARVIHLSLAALATDPALWTRLHKPGGEYLLLQKYDLEDLAGSGSLAALGSAGPALRAQAAELTKLVGRPLDAIPPLDQTPSLRFAPPEDQVPATTLTVGVAPVLGSWIDDHLPPPTPVTLERPSWRARVAGYCSLAFLTAIVAAVFLVPPVLPVAGLAVAAAVAIVSIVLPWRISFARLPQSREYRTRHRALTAARAQYKQVEEQLKWQLAAREMSIDSYQQDLRVLTDRRTRIDRDAMAEYARIDRWRDQELAKLVRERTNLQAWKSAETVNRTAAVEWRHLGEQLARHRIDTAQIANIGRGVAAELEAVGIRTAADFRGIRLQGGFGRPTTAVILHRDGRALKVAMVGEVRAKSLDAWREGLAARVRGKMPPQLTAAIRAQLDAEAAAKAKGLTTREGSVKAAAEVQRRTALGQSQAQRETLVADEQSTRSSHAAAIAVIDRDCTQHREGAEAAQRRLRAEQRALDAYRAVRFRRYLRGLVTGRP